MTGPQPETADFSRQRNAGMKYIALSFPVAILLWVGIAYLTPPLAGMETVGARILFALQCWCLSVLFTLVLGVEAVAHERLSSPAFDPLVGFETRRLLVNQRYLQNTLEQIVVFTPGLFGLAAYCSSGSSMRVVVATTFVWIAARFAFWVGYHHSAAMRSLGAPGVMMSMIVLLFVVGHFGYDVAGVIGAIVPVALFLGIEAYLFRATRPLS